jgi:hypothetical protein
MYATARTALWCGGLLYASARPLLRLTGARANPPKFFNLLELFMTPETPEAELARLLKEQDETMQDEIFVGMSRAVRAEYERRAKRIEELRVELRNRPNRRMITSA